MVHLSEGWPVGGLPVPALSHQSVDPSRAARRTLHPVSALQQLNQIILKIFQCSSQVRQTEGQLDAEWLDQMGRDEIHENSVQNGAALVLEL